MTQIPTTSRTRIVDVSDVSAAAGVALSASTVTPSASMERKPAGDVVRELLATGELHAHLGRLLEQAQERRVTRQHTDLTLGGAGDEHLGIAGPHALLDGDDLDVQLVGHAVSLFVPADPNE